MSIGASGEEVRGLLSMGILHTYYMVYIYLFLKIFGGHKSFLWGH